MKYLIYLVAIIILAGVNVGLFNNLQLFGQIPNLLLLFTICAALEKNNYDFFFIALVSGIFLDFYSASFFGSFTIGLLLVALFLNFLVNTFVVLELNWKSLSLLVLASLVFLDFFLWSYGLLAYRLNWSVDFVSLKAYSGSFFSALIYNWLLLYPTYVFYTFTRRLVDNLSLRRRGSASN
jgi:rod shape-determining protein MreD